MTLAAAWCLDAPPTQSVENSTVSCAYDATEQQAYDALTNAFGIDQSYWQWFDDIVHEAQTTSPIILNDAASACPLNADRFTYALYEVCTELGINARAITLRYIDDRQQAEACAWQLWDSNRHKLEHIIEINVPAWQSADQGLLLGTLAHECMHLVCFDSFKLGCIKGMFTAMGLDASAYETHPDFIAYLHSIENRADMLTAQKSERFGKALYRYLAQFDIPDVSRDLKVSTHPAYTHRLANIQNALALGTGHA